jgi:ATP-binding cassette, subfamily C (CFTR/MRP), member 1
MQIYGRYVNVKQICSALYFNAGVIISSIIFIFADPNSLQLGKVFSTIALLGYVFNFSVLYSNYAIEALYTIIVFNKRVDQIVTQTLDFADKNQNAVEETQRMEVCLSCKEVDVIWSAADLAESGQPVLKSISFQFRSGDKVALIGRVGCGKSTLLHAILGEALVSQGKIEVSGKLAIAEQNPIIVTGTVRSNILFGSPYDKEWYDKVIATCQLTQDFKQFPKSDLTETGEMGVTLSGG